MRRLVLALLLLAVAAPAPAWAGEADVVAARAARAQDGSYGFEVTIRSRDKGWDYYCDRFEVVSPDGKVLGIRELLHPHETEQPFTRALQGVRIPAGTTHVVIRARHKPRGYGGETVRLALPH